MLKHLRLLSTLLFFVLCLPATAAYADDVTLTGGTASTLAGDGAVHLTGTNFSLNYSGELIQGRSGIPINSVTLSLGSPFLSFNSIESRFFGGGLTFNDSTLTGSLTAYASMDDMFFGSSPLFTLNFSGAGFLTSAIGGGGFTQTTFTIGQAPSSTATPEPATMLLLGTGLAAVAGYARRQRMKGVA